MYAVFYLLIFRTTFSHYRWLKNKDRPSKCERLPVKIKEILSEHPDNKNYGYDRIHKQNKAVYRESRMLAAE